jgi:WD40 repeat protein/serine/threonine protein kinase
MPDRDLYGCTLGEFVLREPIGRGGYGTVYRCEQPVLKRDAVIKVLDERRQRNDGSRERFLREAQLASRLDHPYAAHIYAFGAVDDDNYQDGILWLAMELVHGIPLDKWLETHGPMPPEQLVPFFECVAEVVQEAHDRGIVHRDLKPSNIMVIERGGRLFPKLLDFGIAKMNPEIVHPVPTPPMPASSSEGSFSAEHETGCVSGTDGVVTARVGPTPQRARRTRPAADPARPAGGRLTGSGACLGSRAYMSPEQWCDPEAVGPAADIYSLGVVAFEALTGRVPFTAESTDEYFQKHRYAAVPKLDADFVPDLDRVIQCAMAKYPQARYRNVLELAAALRAALRASEREQLRTSAEQWEARGRPPGLLWGADVLSDVANRVPPEMLSKLECSFLATAQQRARRFRWLRRFVVALVAVAAIVIGIMKTRLAQEQTRSAERLTEVTVTQAHVEQGRQSLSLGDTADAQTHLGEAYKRGDVSASTKFMLARAMQPRMAERATFPATKGRMWSSLFSPDGRRIVTTDDKNAQVWDARSRQLLFTLPHDDTVYHAVYSVEGTRLITASGDGTVKIWDATDGTLLRSLMHDGLKLRYAALAVSPDGKRLAAMDMTGTCTNVWDAATGASLAELHNNSASELPSLGFSSDGRWLATSGGGDVRVFETTTWRPGHVLEATHVRSMSWDPTGPRVLTGTATGDASIWDVPSGRRVRHLREVGESVDAVAFAPNGELVVTASRDGAEQVWHARSGLRQSQFNHLRRKILSVEFDTTSTLVLSAGASGTVVVADAIQGMPVAVLEGPKNVVRVAHFDPTSLRVVGASWDGTARVWDSTPPYRRWSSTPIDDDCGVVASLVPDQRFVAIDCRDHSTLVWDTARDLLLGKLPAVTPVAGDFTSAFPAVSARGDRAAIARENSVEVYELPGGRLLRTISHSAAVSAVAFTPSGHDIVSGAVDGSLFVTRDDRDPIVLPATSGGVDAAAILPDGRVVVMAAKQLRVYGPEHNSVLAELVAPARAMLMRVSDDGRSLITVPSYTQADPPALWDLESYRLVAQLEGHAQVRSVRFVAGHKILTAGSDGAARLWEATGRLLQTYRGSTRFLADATLSPDDAMVVAGDADGLLRFWDTGTGRPLWTLQVHTSHVIGVHFEGADIVTRGFAGDVARWTLPAPERVIEQIIAACGALDTCGIVRK